MEKLIITKYLDGGLTKSKDGGDPNRVSIYVTVNTFRNTNGAIWKQKRIAHLGLPKELAESFDIQEGGDLNVMLKKAGLGAHKVQMVESLEPFFEGQEPKKRGEDGDVITDDSGNEIFQDYKCVPDTEAFMDILVERSRQGEAVAQAEDGDLAQA